MLKINVITLYLPPLLEAFSRLFLQLQLPDFPCLKETQKTDQIGGTDHISNREQL
jgi:hypothetical protein